MTRQTLYMVSVSLACLVVGGCASDFELSPYAGVGLGASRLELDTAATNLSLERSQSLAASVLVGARINQRVAIEGVYADLGAAELSNNIEVGYATASLSGLIRMLPRRRGFNVYGRLGAGVLQNKESDDTSLQVEARNAAHVVTGLGMEYNFQNGLALRAEATGHDADAQHGGFNLVYHFGGANSRQIAAPQIVSPAPVQSGSRPQSRASELPSVAPTPAAAPVAALDPEATPFSVETVIEQDARSNVQRQNSDQNDNRLLIAPLATQPPVPVFISLGTIETDIPDVETAASAQSLAELGVDLSINKPAPVATKRAPRDVDGDGVEDTVDQCLSSKAIAPVGPDGCYFYQGFQSGIGFEAATETLTAAAQISLQKVARDMLQFELAVLRVQVQSNDTSSAATLLARKQTLSVIRYLVKLGVAGTRLKPAAPLINSSNVQRPSDAIVSLTLITQ